MKKLKNEEMKEVSGAQKTGVNPKGGTNSAEPFIVIPDDYEEKQKTGVNPKGG